MEDKSNSSFIKETIDKIIGDDAAFIKRKKKKYIDSEYSFFQRTVTNLEKCYVRNLIMNNQLNVNLDSYIDPYMVILDEFIVKYYGAEAADYIFHYIYERINVDGSLNPYIEGEDEIYIKSPHDLWMKILPMVTNKK